MTILYVNGDSHSAGAEAVNTYAFANDDPLYWSLGRLPHPDNEKASYGCLLANEIHAVFHCDAESASSNTRIIRTTRDYLNETTPSAVVIGWSTWEREEWLHEGTYYQVTASGTDTVPNELKQRYKHWVIEQTDKYIEVEQKAHEEIWQFHQELTDKHIPHLFFNTYRYFRNTVEFSLPKYDWGDSYVDPYSEEYTYYYWLKNHGYNTVNPNSYHFGADAHRAWAEFLKPKLTKILEQ